MAKITHSQVVDYYENLVHKEVKKQLQPGEKITKANIRKLANAAAYVGQMEVEDQLYEYVTEAEAYA